VVDARVFGRAEAAQRALLRAEATGAGDEQQQRKPERDDSSEAR
jgi:hypothetical protein